MSTFKQLHGTLDGALPVHILVDPLGGEPLAGPSYVAPGPDVHAERINSWGKPITPVRLHKSIPLPAYQHPYLVTLASRDDELLPMTLKLAEAEQMAATADGLDGAGAAHHRIAGWLQSPLPADRLATRLSTLMRLRLQARTDLTYLRLADRRTLGLLRHVLGTSKFEKHLGAIDRWCYIDVIGDLASLEPKDAGFGVLVLSKKQWDCLALAEAINPTIAKWIGERRRCSVTAGVEITDLYTRVIQAVRDAQPLAERYPHRFLSGTDASTWCALTLDIPSLPALPQVLTMLAHQGSDDDPAEPLRHLHTQLRALAGAALQHEHPRHIA